MKRTEWLFEYVGSKLAEAARARLIHHRDRLTWWQSRKEEILTKIRSEGLEVDENVALTLPHPKARDWERGANVMIRNDLQQDLDQCLRKLAFHSGQSNQYEGWVEVLAANPGQTMRLDYEDWQFFFGKDQ